ncbi:hypothetical protein BE04_08000 [Sorangium cellulosum]|jgi:hypothetical protein|uniref:Uncharacterized protein n=1 Tax=Sorangium cellulosum TaxID=56 RepID=A0A150NZ17_SORCE|nr:hypothetical protein BE04_08000 [Sorangium cellulosum]
MWREGLPDARSAQAAPDNRCSIEHAAARRGRARVSDSTPVFAVLLRRGKHPKNRVPAFSISTGIDTNEE